jgi:thioredoxin-dependent peroxiredoxin
MASTEAQIGAPAPEFELPDQQGQLWRLRDQRGKVVVLLFYPGDETPVCTKQLCSVRDNWEHYQATGAEVVGLNRDSSEKHQRFRLLADTEGEVVRAYGMKNFLGIKRGVVVIDRAGVVRYRRTVLPVFRPTDDEVLSAIKAATDS